MGYKKAKILSPKIYYYAIKWDPVVKIRAAKPINVGYKFLIFYSSQTTIKYCVVIKKTGKKYKLTQVQTLVGV